MTATAGALFLLWIRPLSSRESFLHTSQIAFLLYVPLTTFWSPLAAWTLHVSGLLFFSVTLWVLLKGLPHDALERLEKWTVAVALAAVILAFEWKSTASTLAGDVFGAKRAFSFLGRPGHLSAFVLISLTLVARRLVTPSGRIAWGWVGVAGFFLIGLWAAGGVAPFAALTAAGFFSWFFFGRILGKKSFLLVVLFGASAVFLIFSRGPENWVSLAFERRFLLWERAVELWKAAPWFGTGFGTFDWRYQEAGFPLTEGSRLAHNFLLQTLVEGGVAGTCFLLVALGDLFRRLEKPRRAGEVLSFTGTLAYLLYGLLEIPFSFPGVLWFFPLVLARLNFRQKESFFQKPLRKAHISWVWSPLLGGFVLLTYGFFKPFAPWPFAVASLFFWTFAIGQGFSLAKLPKVVWVAAAYFLLRALAGPGAHGTVVFFQGVSLTAAAAAWLSTLSDEMKKKILWGIGWVWIGADLFGMSPLGFPNIKHLGFFALFLFWCLWDGKRSFRAYPAAAFVLIWMALQRTGAAVFGLAAGLFFKARFKSVFAGLLLLGLIFAWRLQDPSDTKWDRLWIWKDAGKIIQQHPWFGAGPGAFAYLYHEVKTPRTSGFSRYLMDARFAHNEYLDLGAAFGLTGAAFFLLLVLLFWRALDQEWKKKGVLSMAAFSSVDYVWRTPAALFAAAALVSKPNEEKRKPSLVAVFLVLGLGACLWLSPACARWRKEKMAPLFQEKPSPGLYREWRALAASDPFRAEYAAFSAKLENELYLETKDATWRRKSNESLERAMLLEPLDAALWLQAARMEEERLRVETTEEQSRKADLAWEEALRRAPLDAFSFFEAGMYALRKGNRIQALERFERAVELEPNYAAAWWNLGVLKETLGEQQEATACFVRAGEIRRLAEKLSLFPAEKALAFLPEGLVNENNREGVKRDVSSKK